MEKNHYALWKWKKEWLSSSYYVALIFLKLSGTKHIHAVLVMHTIFLKKLCLCFFKGIDKLYPNKWERNYGDWRKDCILNSSSGKMQRACWWSEEHESQFPLSKRVKYALLFRRSGFVFKSFISTTPNRGEYKLLTATSTRPKPVVQEYIRISEWSSEQHMHLARAYISGLQQEPNQRPSCGSN